jgi:hypothetical protein
VQAKPWMHPTPLPAYRCSRPIVIGVYSVRSVEIGLRLAGLVGASGCEGGRT